MVQGSIPIYEGGLDDSKVRQAKETLGQDRIQLDSSRAAVRQAVIAAWGQLDATRRRWRPRRRKSRRNQLALSGVIEERKVGQRTTLDVLNAQQTLLNCAGVAGPGTARQGGRRLHAAGGARRPRCRRP